MGYRTRSSRKKPFAFELGEEVPDGAEGFLHLVMEEAISFVEESAAVRRRFTDEECSDDLGTEAVAQILQITHRSAFSN